MSLQTPKTKSSIGEKFANALNEDLKIVNRIRERSLSSGSNEKLLHKLTKELSSQDTQIKKEPESSIKQEKSLSVRLESPISANIPESAKKVINTNTVHVNKWALQDQKNNSEKKKAEDPNAHLQNATQNWDRKASFKQKLISDSLNRLKPTSNEPEYPTDDINKIIEKTRVSTADIFSTQANKTTSIDESFQSLKLKASLDLEKEEYLAKNEERIQQYKFHLQSPQTNNSRISSKSPSRSSLSPNRSINKSPSTWKKSQQEIQEAIERAASLPKRLETSYSNESDISTRPESRNQSFVAKPKPTHHERSKSIQLDVVKKFQNNTEIKEEVIEETERLQPVNNQRSSLRTPDFNEQQSSKRRAQEALVSAKNKASAKSKTPTHRTTASIDTGSLKRTPLATQPKSNSSSKAQLKSLTQSQASSKKSISTSASKKDIRSLIGIKPVSRAIENEILKKTRPNQASIDSSYASYKKLNQSLNLSRKDLITEPDKHELSFEEKKNITFDHSPIKADLSMSMLGNDLSKDEFILKAEILKNPELTTEYELFVKLEEVIQKVSIKHFIHLRNILKPHSAILLICQSLVKLLAGLDEFLPSDFTDKKLTWNEIRILFNIPSRFLNLISFYKELVVKGDIPIQNLNAAEEILSSIKNPPPKSDAYTIIFEFMCYAIQFYRHFLKTYEERDTSFQDPIIEREEVQELKIIQSTAPEKPVASHPNPFSTIKKRKGIGSNIGSSLASATVSSQKRTPLKESSEKKSTPKEPSEKQDFNRTNDSMINYFEQDLENGNKSLNSITEKKNELLKKLESYTISNRTQSKPQTPKVTTPGKSLNKTLDKENNSSKINKSKSQTREKSAIKTAEKPSETPEKIEIGHSTRYGDGRIYRTMKDVVVYDKIEDNEKEARDYRHRVKKLLADHEKFVKNKIIEEEKAAYNFDRQELLAERKRFLAYMEVENTKETDFIRQMKHETFTTKKEAKERSILEAKTDEYDELLRNYDIHLMKESIVQKEKAQRMKELHDSQQNMAIKKLLKKKKEAEEQAQLFDELAERSKKRLESKLQAAESDKKKWQNDYILLTNLIKDAK